MLKSIPHVSHTLRSHKVMFYALFKKPTEEERMLQIIHESVFVN